MSKQPTEPQEKQGTPSPASEYVKVKVLVPVLELSGARAAKGAVLVLRKEDALTLQSAGKVEQLISL